MGWENRHKPEISQTVQTSATAGRHIIGRISSQSYFCWIAKFGKDILTHGRAILQVEDFHYGDFDLEL